MHIETKSLPSSVQSRLRARGYNKRDVAIEVAETVCPLDCGSDGQRGYCDIIDLESGAVVREFNGSWGGANMFNPANRVDLDSADYPIPANALVIKGSAGYRNYATIIVGVANAPALLPSPVDLSEREKRILATIRSTKGGQYRKSALDAMNVVGPELDSLADRGFLKINKAGAVRITTSGKNACSGIRVF